MTNRMRWTAAIAMVAATIGEAGAQGTRGDTVVRLAGAPRHAGITALVEELSIGAADGPPEYTFGQVAEIAVAADGSIIVVDRPAAGTPFVRRYDANGKLVQTIGRSGQGPGEYTAPSGIGVLRDGRILLRDGANHRINVYSAAGEPVGSWRLNETGTSIGSGMLTVDTSGTVWLRAQTAFAGPTTGPRPVRLVRLRPDGSLIDTVDVPQFPPANAPLSARSGGSNTSLGLPYSPDGAAVLSPLGYFVTGTPARYAVDLRIPRTGAGSTPLWRVGDPVVSLRREVVQPVPVTDAERAERRADLEARLRRTDPGWRWSGPDIPRVKQAFQSIRVGADGRVWVLTSQPSERFDPAVDQSPSTTLGFGGGGRGGRGPSRPPPPPPVPWRSPTVYDLFEPSGVYLGQLRVPYGVTMHVMRGDQIWASTADADGVPYVKRYRIDWR